MSYQVLALKWRPRTFEEVVGQDHVTRTLQNAIRQERVPHAFLFTGGRGVGKTTTARILAKALICEHGPTPEPCGTCHFCEDVREGRSLDVLEIDGASNTGVDNVRELRENAGYAPAAARLKIYIIDEVHMLSTAAFNALLKTLEEPPAHVKFIFATTEIKKVPITIQSRCQRFDFRLLSREEILAQLKKIVAAEEVEIGDTALAAIAAAAEGSLRDSQTLLDQVLAFSGRKVEEKDVYEALGIAEEKTVLDFLEGLLAGDGTRCIRTIDELSGAGYDPKSFTREILTGLRNLAVLKTSPELGDLVTASREGLDELRALSGPPSLGKLQSLFDIFLRAEGEIRNTSYPRMLLELAVMRAVRMEEIGDLRDLVERLEGLESKLPAAGKAAPPAPGSAPGTHGSPGKKMAEPVRSYDETAPVPEEEEPDVPPRPEGSPDGRAELFSRLVEGVRKDGVVLGSFLQHGTLARQDDRELEIAFEAGNSLFLDTLNEPENLALLRRVARDVTGKKMEVRLVSLEGEAKAGQEKKKKESDLRRKHRREVLEHPLIQGMLDVFQADVVDIKVL
jgi:DNA polymerase-3 subunit gamma/tau